MAGSARLLPPEGAVDGAERPESDGRAEGSLGSSRSDGRPLPARVLAGSRTAALGVRALPPLADGWRGAAWGVARSPEGLRVGDATPEVRGAVAAPPARARSEGRASGAAARVGADVDEGGMRFTAGLDDGRVEAEASPERTPATGAASALVAGRRVAVRAVEPRGSSL